MATLRVRARADSLRPTIPVAVLFSAMLLTMFSLGGASVMCGTRMMEISAHLGHLHAIRLELSSERLRSGAEYSHFYAQSLKPSSTGQQPAQGATHGTHVGGVAGVPGMTVPGLPITMGIPSGPITVGVAGICTSGVPGDPGTKHW